jgi:hypothetical protein
MSLGSQDSKKSFAGGLLVGIGGAILGLILFAAVGIIFELQIGFVSLAVGWIVGRAVLLGSGNVGGRRYQIMAALLTYAAVSMSVIPLVVWNVATGDAKVESKDAKNAEPSGAQPGADSSNPADGTKESADSASASSAVVAVIGILGYLAVIGLASPFLELAEPVSGIIGLVILFVGIRIAWQMTAGAGIAVRGPYNA